MALNSFSRMLWKVTTCRCQIEYLLTRDNDNFDGAIIQPVEIIEQCDAHALATDAGTLDAMVAGENEVLAKAYACITAQGSGVNEHLPVFSNDGLRSWSINEARQVEITVGTGLSEVSQAGLAAISNLVVTYDSDDDDAGTNGERELNEVVYPEARDGEGRSLQGARQDTNSRHQAHQQAWESYFNVVGGALQFFHNEQLPEEYGPAAYESSQHVVNFDGSADFFAIRVDANHRDQAVQYRLRINDLETTQWVTVPPYRMGVFICLGHEDYLSPPLAPNDSIVGYATSPDISTFPGDDRFYAGMVNTRMVTWELLSDAGTHTLYSAREPAFLFNGGVPPPAFSSYPIAGGLNHYRSYITLEESTAADDAEKPLDWLVRSPGTLSYLQVGWEPEDRSALIGLRVNFLPVSDWESGPIPEEPEVLPYPHVEITAAESGDGTFKTRVDDENFAEIESGDLVSTVGFDQPVGEWDTNTIHSIGVNWEAASGSDTIDMIVQESRVDAEDVDPEQLRDEHFQFVTTDNGETAREWFASPLGTYHPRTARQVEAMPLHWNDIELFPTFHVEISRMRGFLDTNQLGSELSIRLGVALGHGAIGDSAADVGDSDFAVGAGFEGWYENELDTDEVVVGRGFCLRFAAPLAAISATAHISMVCYSYQPASAGDDRACLERVLPEAGTVEPLPNLVRLARSVKIVRPDGEVFTYTEHDRDITYDLGDGDGERVYKSCGGFEGSASELGSVLGEVGNMEVRGFAKALGISVDDLFGGMFDGATAEVWLLPWGEGNTQPARRHGGGVFGPVKQGDRRFTLEALSWSEYLKRRSLLGIYTPTCRHKLGPIPEGAITGCGVNLDCMRVSGTVTGVEDDIPNGAPVRLTFYDTSRTEENGWFAEGEITFTSGANVGQVRTVKYSKLATGEITVWEPLVHPVEAGDTYTMLPGCDKTKATCISKFNNLVNDVRGGFGGFSTIPGLDATSQTPTGRSGE